MIDKQFPTFGFGAKLKLGVDYTGAASHCFALNGNIFDPECDGLDGVLSAYKQSLHNVDFYPLVFESFGRIGRGGASLIRRLATRAATDRGLSAPVECSRWLERLVVSLQLSQAEVLLDG